MAGESNFWSLFFNAPVEETKSRTALGSVHFMQSINTDTTKIATNEHKFIGSSSFYPLPKVLPRVENQKIWVGFPDPIQQNVVFRISSGD